ncbi:MAG: lipocalin-like domain-containing protein [bacterium]
MSRRPVLCILLWILTITFIMTPSGVSPESFFRQVLPGYEYAFPRDHFSHPDFQTEWWYYTGHLRTEEGKTYGYELTFFRTGIESQRKRESPSAWVMRDVYFAHLALSDENKREFRFWEKLNRKGPGLAGAEEGRLLVWNEGWRIEGVNGAHRLLAAEAGFGIDLLLTPLKPLVIHGEEGISRKSLEPGHASHYYSLTRIRTKGSITVSGTRYDVSGQSWMDHEFFSHMLAEDQEGWDWFSIQLDNDREIMLYQLRLTGGAIDPVSSGTIIGPEGEARHLTFAEFSITPLSSWKSARSGAKYPAEWEVSIPGQGIRLRVRPTFPDQELKTRQTTYWEGNCTISGTFQGEEVSGVGYAELTGYAASL